MTNGQKLDYLLMEKNETHHEDKRKLADADLSLDQAIAFAIHEIESAFSAKRDKIRAVVKDTA